MQALTCGTAVNLGFENYLIYSGKQPRIDSTNKDYLNATLSVPSPHLQILRLCLLAVQQKTLACFSSVLYEHNRCTDRTSRSHPASANTAATPKHQQLMHPLARKLPHQEGDCTELVNSATLPQPIYPWKRFSLCSNVCSPDI